MMNGEEFTKEGQELWDNLDNPAYLSNLENSIVKKPRKVGRTQAVDQIYLKGIVQLRENSIAVVKECIENIPKFVQSEDYVSASRARLAGYLHKNFARRLKRILDGLPAIESEIEMQKYMDMNDLTLDNE